MKIISHRGNLNGPKPDCENNPIYIDQAITEGFNVEIDVWFVDGEFFLGHDRPTYLVDTNWISIRSASLWCHAKNIEAMENLLLMDDVICFWHENDKMTLTSIGVPWMYPGNYTSNGVTVEFGKRKIIPDVFGVCTDYPKSWIIDT
jgi:hypothetical protein